MCIIKTKILHCWSFLITVFICSRKIERIEILRSCMDWTDFSIIGEHWDRNACFSIARCVSIRPARAQTSVCFGGLLHRPSSSSSPASGKCSTSRASFRPRNWSDLLCTPLLPCASTPFSISQTLLFPHFPALKSVCVCMQVCSYT